MKKTAYYRQPGRPREEPLIKLLGEIVLFAAGTAFFLYLFMYIFIRDWNWIPKEDKVSATAVITDINRYIEGRSLKYDVHIRYTVEGQELESRMDDYFFKMQVGDVIPIYYDQNHPDKAQLKGMTKDMYLCLAPVLLFGTLSLWDLRKIIELIKDSRRRKRTADPEQ